MTIERLMQFAQAYAALGTSIQRQVDDIANGDYGNLNLNAAREANQRLKGYHEDLDAALVEALLEAK